MSEDGSPSIAIRNDCYAGLTALVKSPQLLLMIKLVAVRKGPRFRPGLCLVGAEPSEPSFITCSEARMEKDKDQIIETAVEARGGFLGRPVLLVLIISVALAAAFMVFSYMGTPRH
jgi:hypothetical protein